MKQDDYPVYDGVHEAIVSEEVWQMAQRKRQETGVKSEKIYNQEHENILSSILRCPVCGAAMYGINADTDDSGNRKWWTLR